MAADTTPAFVSQRTSNGTILAGIKAFEKGKFAKAAVYQRAAIKSGLSKSRRAAAYTNLCAAQGAAGELEAAMNACEAALAIKPAAWTALNNRGVVQWLSGDTAAAAADFAAANAAGGNTEVAVQNARLASAN